MDSQIKISNPNKTPIKNGQGKGKGKAMYFPHQQQDSQGQTHVKMSGQAKAGLQFSVSRVTKFMKQERYADRIALGAPVYAAAVLQYICSEVIELAGNKVQESKKQRIKPRHIMLAIKDDPELCQLLGNADFAQCGVVPKIYNIEKKGKKGKKCCEVDEELT